MTLDEFLSVVLLLIPEAEVGEDNDGQLIIYTNLTLNADGNIETMPDA